MSKKLKYLKNKKLLFVVGTIFFLLAYYLFFAQGKVDLTYSAEDLKVKTIDNKNDFEDKIIKNIYDKIVESCEPEYENRKYEQDFGIDIGFDSFDGSISNLKGSSMETNIVSGGVNITDSLGSIDFDGSKPPEVKVTQDVSFSQTNIQKQEVDEGDILKQTKDYIFYFSKNKSKIYIIASPIDGKEINFDNIEAIYTINIPSNLTIKPELFVNDNRLVYLASKSAYNNNNTIVGIYDISNLKNKEVKLHKIFETKGDYFKSRLIDNNLYLISDYSLAPFKNQFCNVINNEEHSDIGEFISFFTGINFGNFGVNEELFNELKEELESYSYNFNDDNLSEVGEYEKLEQFKIFYTNKDLKESIENLNFNVVSVVDIDNKEVQDTQTLFFGNLKNGEIHMTLDNLYLINSYYQKEEWKCDYIDICYKEFSSNNFTSISKISYTGNNLEYLKTSIIPGKPINQYSMDEDEGYFRIFTAHGSRNRNAALYVFDNKLKLIGELENIKPNEEFKSSRFIGDKAFLVTFRKKDPLFVIDLHIPATPKIVGELHIPGYSSYLHPYGKFGNKEYLIGIGQENNNVKVDLYEIDYEKKGLGDQIEVIQKYKYIFNGTSSTTPAETNPRTFVWDKEDKILYLPMKINGWYNEEGKCREEKVGCELIGINNSSNKKIYRKYQTQFIGLKALKIEIENEIEEVESKLSGSNDIINSRVGYYKTAGEKVLFFIDNKSIGFFGDGVKYKEVNFY